MPRVQLLPPDLINKIAAGEVVVRPASAVKELVENSLDAGATRVEVEITHACRDIAVTDDGCGMEAADARAALERHATSKIASIDDLLSVKTSGFRGEAIPSMASVSRMKILTRPPDQLHGTLIEVDGGILQRETAHAAPAGTRIEVRDLFFNVPARRKFLRSSASELNQILSIVSRLALARPDVTFTLVADGRERLAARGPVSHRERTAQILGTHYGADLIEVDYTTEGRNPPSRVTPPAQARVFGLIGPPKRAAKSRTRQYFFANGRPIAHRRLPAVLQQAYRGILMTGRFPVAVLFVEVPPEQIDVNVHPTKEEVRFANEDLVCSIVYHGAQAALSRADLMPELRVNQSAGRGQPAAEVPREAPPYQLTDRQLHEMRSSWFGAEGAPLKKRTAASPSQGDLLGARHDASPGARTDEPNAADIAPSSSFESQTHAEPPELTDEIPRHLEPARDAEIPFFNGPPPRALGQIGTTYIFAEVGENGLLIDQHAAHERLLYHRIAQARRRSAVQTLLIPVAVDLPASVAGFIDDLLGPLEDLGIHVEPFGGNTYVVHSVPADLPNLDAGALLVDLLGDFEESGRLQEMTDIRERLTARLACRAAIKAGQTLSLEEMNALLRDMRDARLPFTCPHGRPTMLLLTRDQLDRQFGRQG